MAKQTNINNPSKQIETLLKWIRSNGGKYNKLNIRQTSNTERSVITKRKIQTNDLLIYIPLSLIITDNVINNSDIGKKIIDSNINLSSKHSIFAMFLLFEQQNPNSFWKPYLDTLPRNFNHVPIFFNDDLLKQLQGSHALTMIINKKASLATEFNNLCNHVPECAQFNLHDFMWGRSITITRIFGFYMDEIKTRGLVPLVDMCNHKYKDTKWYFSDETNGFNVNAIVDIKKGGEIYVSYGQKCNSRFFVNYGFVLKDNNKNEAAINLSIDNSDPNYHLKNQLLNNDSGIYKISKEFSEKTKYLLSCIMIKQLNNAQELNSIIPNTNILPFSLEREKDTLRFFIKLCSDAINNFATTLKEDQLYLKERLNNLNVNNIVRMCKGEKEVLYHNINLARKCLELLQLPLNQIASDYTEYLIEDSSWELYIQSIIQLLQEPQTQVQNTLHDPKSKLSNIMLMR